MTEIDLQTLFANEIVLSAGSSLPLEADLPCLVELKFANLFDGSLAASVRRVVVTELPLTIGALPDAEVEVGVIFDHRPSELHRVLLDASARSVELQIGRAAGRGRISIAATLREGGKAAALVGLEVVDLRGRSLLSGFTDRAGHFEARGLDGDSPVFVRPSRTTSWHDFAEAGPVYASESVGASTVELLVDRKRSLELQFALGWPTKPTRVRVLAAADRQVLWESLLAAPSSVRTSVPSMTGTLLVEVVQQGEAAVHLFEQPIDRWRAGPVTLIRAREGTRPIAVELRGDDEQRAHGTVFRLVVGFGEGSEHTADVPVFLGTPIQLPVNAPGMPVGLSVEWPGATPAGASAAMPSYVVGREDLFTEAPVASLDVSGIRLATITLPGDSTGPTRLTVRSSSGANVVDVAAAAGHRTLRIPLLEGSYHVYLENALGDEFSAEFDVSEWNPTLVFPPKGDAGGELTVHAPPDLPAGYEVEIEPADGTELNAPRMVLQELARLRLPRRGLFVLTLRSPAGVDSEESLARAGLEPAKSAVIVTAEPKETRFEGRRAVGLVDATPRGHRLVGEVVEVDGVPPTRAAFIVEAMRSRFAQLTIQSADETWRVSVGPGMAVPVLVDLFVAR